ncbi:type VII secretion target [Glycomyces salinus]|uniref:type VII secretion target n=1 Tax=Glycomyces salinus TaxID=980294 RepID=UPI0018EBE27B|nr:type VII secretion target [Glycomyces salinus]
MSDAINVDPEEIAGTGQKFIGIAQDQFTAISTAREDFYVDHADFGKYSSCAEAALAHHDLAEAAGRAVERLTTAIEQESDDLIGTAFSYQDADDQAATDFSGLDQD